MEYITLSKVDPEFESHLLGTFSSTHRALPVETYHPQTPRERVTFRIVPLEKMAAPPWWTIYFWSCRPELLGLTMGPAVAAWLNQRERLSEWARWPSWFALLGVFFLHVAASLMNDVQDHLRGLDRQMGRRGSQVIQKGWVSAASMRRWAWVNAALAVVFGIPALLNAPLTLLWICILAGLSLSALLSHRVTRWGVADVAQALLFGPLLTMGIALASFGRTTWNDAILGCAFGALSVWVMQMRQFEYLFRAKPEGFRTFLGFLAFDRARAVGVIEAAFLLILQPLAAFSVGVPLRFLLILPLVSIPLILFMGRLRGAASPLSSNLMRSDRWALASHISFTLWWVMALGLAWV